MNNDDWQWAVIAPVEISSRCTTNRNQYQRCLIVQWKRIRVRQWAFAICPVCQQQYLRIHPEDFTTVLGFKLSEFDPAICLSQILTD
jgi:hypothetical protein